jgi:hypothetical protein
MKERQRLFSRINRIFLMLCGPLSIALAVYYLFTVNVTHCLLSILTLIWLVIPYLIQRIHPFRPGHFMLFSYYLFILSGYIFGQVLSLNFRFSIYDAVVHGYGGFFFCLLAVSIFCFHTKARHGSVNYFFCLTFCICFSLAVFIFLELIQIFYCVHMIHVQYVLQTSLFHILFWLLGIVLFVVLTALKRFKHIHTYPLYTYEDFCVLNIKSSIEIVP